MNILIRNSDNLVLYAEPSIGLDIAGARGSDWVDPNFTSENARVEDLAELPDLWIGAVWSYAGGVWAVVDEDRHAILVAAAEATSSPVPEQVTMLNARLALIEAGHMANVNTILAASPGIDGEKARTFFEFAQNVRRDHPVVEALRVALGLTHADIDALFILAMTVG